MSFSATWLNIQGFSGLHKTLHQRGETKKGEKNRDMVRNRGREEGRVE